MRQAIQTRLAPISSERFKCDRIIAWCAAGRRYYDWVDSLAVDANHRLAAMTLASELDWKCELSGGQLYNGDYVWTQI